MFRRRVTLLMVALLLVLCTAFCFVACDDPGASDGAEKHVTVYIGEKTISAVTQRTYLHGLLQELKDDGKITDYEFSSGMYGISMTKVDALSQDPSFTTPPYLSVWHSVDEFDIKSVYNEQWASSNPARSTVTEEDGTKFITYTHNGTLLYYSGVGVGTLPVYDGATYAIFLD